MMLPLKLMFGIPAVLFRLFLGFRFARWGKRSLIVAPVGIERPDLIEIGDDVYVAAHGSLSAYPHTGLQECRLIIGDGTKLGRFNHIYATGRLEIGRKVLTANGVYISDNRHGFEDPDQAIVDQPIRQLSPTKIGDGTWVGHNASIYGVQVGRNCVIGANAVVTRDMPDHSVAVGAPARIVKRYNPSTSAWEATCPDGRFIVNDKSVDRPQ